MDRMTRKKRSLAEQTFPVGVTVYSDGVKLLEGKLFDISSHGVCVRITETFIESTVDLRVMLIFERFGKVVLESATVRWIDPSLNLVRFIGLEVSSDLSLSDLSIYIK